jgi:hypothetical protein
LFTNAFECYERLEDWDSLVLCLHRHKDQFGKKEREALLEKYFPIALNSVYTLYGAAAGYEDNEMLSEENRGKIQ